MSDLNDLFKVIAEGKKQYEENDPTGKRLKEVKTHVKEDLNDIFAQLMTMKDGLEKELVVLEAKKEEAIINEIATLTAEETLTPELNTIKVPEDAPLLTPQERIQKTANDVARYSKTASFQQPDPDVVSKDIDDIRAKIRFIEQAVGRIAATGPGGGEVNLRWLDDVARETIADGRWLKYNGATKKFVFDEINPYQVIYNTTEVTTPTYTVQDEDFYIGVNYAGPVTITLPTTANSGRLITIKDEDGDAETNPITVVGNVDNDPGGFIIQINNGAIQLIYRNGWRIV